VLVQTNKVVVAAVAAFVMGLACARSQDAGAQGMAGNDMPLLCLSPDLFLSEISGPPPIQLDGKHLRRLLTHYTGFYRGTRPELDLVLVYERGVSLSWAEALDDIMGYRQVGQ